MLKKYFLNFWIWWYGAQLRACLQMTYSFWSLSLATLNILPMLANLFVPMYQDASISGRIISLFFRVVWVFGGSLIQILITIPLISVVFIWVILPPLCLVQIVRFFI
ncbi:hypothetical protein JW766_01185 [Candidatus Dojkabacteria bacterium]|nr:hypothetical protein [Candidatus Dojkabacteria bacterium]